MVEDSPSPYQTTQSEVPGVLVYTCQPSTGQAEAGGLPFKASLGYTVRIHLNKTKKFLVLRGLIQMMEATSVWPLRGSPGMFYHRDSAPSLGRTQGGQRS